MANDVMARYAAAAQATAKVSPAAMESVRRGDYVAQAQLDYTADKVVSKVPHTADKKVPVKDQSR
ncbi:hypothetical protein LQG66_04740 [Bradyrhizobium ontarionense]|uniref:Uncharacterized protein n=1 Tax=Bradyrhizobium ontarionense TaxID=2898149 RepID=A0ABY3REZ8_9BRAD|nr:hypothetical protein [Bradyrhizobium sp. A19]UFZ05627.1 hypothetical protein LQG66_04740 [Bradyrhizobium sp. A19]